MKTLFDTIPQTQRLLNWFNKGQTLTSMEAYEKFKITQLGRCIADLERAGHEFEKPRVRLDSGTIVCRYKLKV